MRTMTLRADRHRAIAALLGLGLFLSLGACRDDEISDPEPSPTEVPYASDPTDAVLTKAEQALIAGPYGRDLDFGDPLPGLSADLAARFEAGKEEFQEEETSESGLGPVFNEVSCAACHDQGSVGGSGEGVETRFGRRYPDGSFDSMEEYGGGLIQTEGITNGDCVQPGEVVPADANIVAGRQTTALFGLGLLEAVPAPLLLALSDPFDRNRDGISGRVNLVQDPATGRMAIGRFGWKAQVSSVLVFSGDAYLNEMGITNNIFPVESAPSGGQFVCDDGITGDVLEDEDLDGDGISDAVEAFTDYMRFLAPPPTSGLPSFSALRGLRLFGRVQCTACHTPVLVTGDVPGVPALSRQVFLPWSDLLLHDMGSLGDGIEQGMARGNEMRTSPLWGLRASAPYLHDGRAATIEEAIRAHDGEGARSRDLFFGLTPAQQRDLLAFLGFI